MEGAGLWICLLGGFMVNVAGQPVPESVWRLRRAKTLVKLLALAPERRLHREQVVELLWPDEAPADNSLHQVLYTARRALSAGGNEEAGPRLALRDGVVTLDGEGLWVDADAFEAGADQARRQRTPDAYRAALDLYTGELLPEDRYESWAGPRRQSLRETHLGLLVELAELQAEVGEIAAAVDALQRAVVEDPLHEVAHRRLMRLFADDGRRQQALAQYQQLRETLSQELAADPDPQTSELYRAILAGQHEPTQGNQPDLPRPASSPTAGEPDPRPAPTSTPGPAADKPETLLVPASTSTLPHQLTSFIGRARELAELEALLDGHSRLLTLTGPGGCGKTRLALELAARSQHHFEQGARLVELAPVEDPALVVGETATAVGVQLRSERDPIDVLAGQIGEARLLLVLDNCEHLIEACAALADGLLRSCPNLRIVATSRERLRVRGEVAWRVPSLSLPARRAEFGLADLDRSEAVRLFCQRAADADREFALSDENAGAVAEICRRLDGMPLALELAAARAAVLSPEQIAQRLGDALGLLRSGSRAELTRQQTLRATIEWSHELLDAPEQLLYRRLGVFAGGFGVEAVEGICADEALPADELFDLVARLADKSLIQVEAGADGHRYRLLETIRQYARERLAAAGERTRIEAAHRAWYLTLAEAADRDAAPEVASAWPAERLEADHDDLRAALASAIRYDPPAALRLATALWWFWMARCDFVEGLRWLEEALVAAPEATADRARALLASGGIAVRLRHGSVGRILDLGAEALEIARAEGDRHAEARGLERLGVMAMGAFDWKQAELAFGQGLELAEELGDDAVTVAIKQAQGVLAGCRGENARARELLEESLALLAEIPDERGPLFWAMHISPVVLPAGPDGAPRAFFEDTFLLLRAVRSRAGSAYVLCNIAEAWRSDGEDEPAREALEHALDRFRGLGDDQGAGVALNALGSLARSTGDFDAGRAWFSEALILRRAARDRREIAMTLAGMGLLALYAGDEHAGHQLIDEATSIFTRTEDGPGLQLVPLSLGGFELDRGDPQRACELLERCETTSRAQGLIRNRGWASAELAEAALALGDHERARLALDRALVVFEQFGEDRGTRYARGLEQRLRALAGAE